MKALALVALIAIVFANSSLGDSNKDPAGRQFDDLANALLADNAGQAN